MRAQYCVHYNPLNTNLCPMKVNNAGNDVGLISIVYFKHSVFTDVLEFRESSQDVLFLSFEYVRHRSQHFATQATLKLTRTYSVVDQTFWGCNLLPAATADH